MTIKKVHWASSLRTKRMRFMLPGLIVLVGLSLLGLQFSHAKRTSAAPAVNTDYTTDWLANSFATDDTHVQGTARSIYVAGDGTVYADAIWNEDGKEIGIYKDGQSIGQFADTPDTNGGNTGITTNGTYFFAATDNNHGIRRYSPDGSAAPFPGGTHDGSYKPTDTDVTGITATANEVYVSASGIIHVYDPNSMNEIRSFNVANSGKLTLDKHDDTLWIVSGTSVVHYGTDGTNLGQQITSGLGLPTGLAVDGSDRLLVADAGPDYNIKIYSNITTNPTLSSTFGVQGGIFAGTGSEIGTFRPLHFNYPNDVGVDDNGNIYVINSMPDSFGATTIIESYTPSGTRRWVLYGLVFEGNGDVDPTTNGAEIFTGLQHFHMDYTKAPGQGWSYVGFTWNPFKYPNDPRQNAGSADFATVRTVQGHRLLFSTFQQGGDVYVNRFNPATDGDVAIPVTTISGYGGYYVDYNGNFWGCSGTTITELPLQGFDANDVPQWGSGITFQAPSEWNAVNRIEYNVATDTMILAGYTQSNPSTGDWGRAGAAIVRYDSWTTNPTKRWEISPILHGDGIIGSGEPETISLAGDYLFIGHFSYPLGPIQQAYDLNTGELVNTFTQNGGVTAGKDVDSIYGVKAYERSNGEYVILKDDYNAYKIVAYRWCPSGNCPEDGSSTPTAVPTPSPTAQPSPTATPRPTITPNPTVTPTPTSTPTSGNLVTAINAGGGASGSFGADSGYDQGNQYVDTSSAIDTSGVSNPAPQDVYQSCRWNSSFTYTISGLTPGASYTVRLHWAELTFQQAGQRLFNVGINGTNVLSDFDVYAAGGYKVAVVRQFSATADSNGQIAINFTQGSADNPFISGIEVYTT